jgi:hypothetical protein
MKNYQAFIFKDYSFDTAGKTLTLHYSFDDEITFSETFRFNFAFADYDGPTLERALQLLFFMAGVSYYKAYPTTEIRVEKGTIDDGLAQFLATTWQAGLGEFFYVNGLDPFTPIIFPTNATPLETLHADVKPGMVVGIGGGKDSLVSVELLRNHVAGLTTWSVGHEPQLTPLVNRINLPHYSVERLWDRSLLKHNEEGARNGHIPISAILACVGVVVAVLSGHQDVVVSNEQSANEPTLHYKGAAINHQYSKSQAFEEAFQNLLAQLFGPSVRYYSFLRPLSEVRIAELFAGDGFNTYHDVFSSCNRAFTHDSTHLFWDGTCPKCAFIFLALTPFVARDKLEALFSDKNLLLEPALEPTYRQLLGIEGDKPLECVGEIKESRAAMRLAQDQYPELSKYHFAIPHDYDYRVHGTHSMPLALYDLLKQRDFR